MFASIVLAATTAIGTQFFDDFGGTWRCTNGPSSSYWNIERPRGNAWTIVTWGHDAHHLGGRAYVGWLAQTDEYVYEDFHNDGSFSQLRATAPSNHLYEWRGVYYANGAKKPDASGDITWQLTARGTIDRHFAQIVDGKRIDRGSDVCTRTSG